MTEPNESASNPAVPPRPPLPNQPHQQQAPQEQAQQQAPAQPAAPWAQPAGAPAQAPWNQPAPQQQAPQQAAPQQRPQQQAPFGYQPPSAPGFGQQQRTQPYGTQQPESQHAPTTPYSAPQQGYPAPGYGGYPQPTVKPRTPKKGLTALILGILGVVGGVFFGWAFPLAIIAIILGFIARKNPADDRGFALWGIITGFAGLVFSIGWFVYSIMYLVMR